MNENDGEESLQGEKATELKGRWKVGPALESHLRSLKDIGYDGVEDRLSKIREATFERMRAQKNNSISWARIVNTIYGRRPPTDHEILGRPAEVEASQPLAASLVSMRSVIDSSGASIMWNGDCRDTAFFLSFGLERDQRRVRPILNVRPFLPAGTIEVRDMLVRLQVPNVGWIDITVENGECVHENCSVIDEENVMNEKSLELLLVDDDKKITLTRREIT